MNITKSTHISISNTYIHIKISSGVKGAQVEELWSLDDEQFDDLK